jgi:protein-disulfide isomerase
MLKPDLSWPEIKQDISSYFGEAKWILLTFALVPAMAWLGNKMYLDSYGFDQINLMIKESLANWKTAPTRSFSAELGLVFQKQDNPKMTIVEFADFRCPHCKMASPTISAFASARKDVQVIFKSFPLDGTCNPHIERRGDGTSCFLAQIVLCAEKIGQKGWDTKKWVFENQERFFQAFDREQVLGEVANQRQLDADELKTCVDSDEILQVIKKMSDEGNQAQIRGTPSFFINNRPLERAQALPVLNAVYSELN